MANQLRSRYDIVINGGGIVGFTLLNLILKSPHLNRCKVLLLEQGQKPATFRQPPRCLDKLSSDSEWGQSEAEKYNERKFSNRVSSITQASKSILKKLGVWDRVAEHSKGVRSIEVWNYEYSQRLHFNQVKLHNHESNDTVFSVLENNRLSLALLESIYADSRAKDMILWQHSLTGFGKSPTQGLVDVGIRSTSSEDEISCQTALLLGCDGFKSKVRDLARFKYSEFDLNKTAIVGTVKLDREYDETTQDNDIAYQRFSAQRDTVAALLPLDREHSSFVISAPNEYAKFLDDCDDESFVIEFNKLISISEEHPNILLKGIHDVTNQVYDRLTNYLNLRAPQDGFSMTSSRFSEAPRLLSVIENSRATFPLIFGTTTPKMVAPIQEGQDCQIALLGDSSHRVHPLAGQGLNLGIQDAAELVKQLEAYAKYGERITDTPILHKALKNYECRRQTYIVPMSAGILSMQTLFKLMPSSFVSAVDKCEPIKRSSVKFANGC